MNNNNNNTSKAFMDKSFNDLIDDTSSSLSDAGDSVLDFSLRDLSGTTDAVGSWFSDLGDSIGSMLVSEKKEEPAPSTTSTTSVLRLMPSVYELDNMTQAQKTQLKRDALGLPPQRKSKFASHIA